MLPVILTPYSDIGIPCCARSRWACLRVSHCNKHQISVMDTEGPNMNASKPILITSCIQDMKNERPDKQHENQCTIIIHENNITYKGNL